MREEREAKAACKIHAISYEFHGEAECYIISKAVNCFAFLPLFSRAGFSARYTRKLYESGGDGCGVGCAGK